MVRVSSDIWVSAYVARLSQENLGYYIVHKGDKTAGAIIIKVALLNGNARLYEQGFDILKNTRFWRLAQEASEHKIDTTIARQHQLDPDLWVIEVEDRSGVALLERSELIR